MHDVRCREGSGAEREGKECDVGISLCEQHARARKHVVEGRKRQRNREKERGAPAVPLPRNRQEHDPEHEDRPAERRVAAVRRKAVHSVLDALSGKWEQE